MDRQTQTKTGAYLLALLLAFGGGVSAKDRIDLPLVTVILEGRSTGLDILSPALEIATSTVDEELLNRQKPRNLAEALNFMPGVHVESRGRKLRELVSFRGQLYPYPTYSIDGLWLGKFDEAIRWFPAAQIGEIEIVRSTAALRMGFSDLTGVINIRPRRFEEQTTLLEGEYGSYNTVRTSVTHGDGGPRGDYMVGINHHRSSGPSGANAAENVQNVIGRGSWDPTDRWRLEGILFYLHGTREWPVPNDPDPGYDARRANPEKYDPFEQYLFGFRASYRDGADVSTELSAVYSGRTGEYHAPSAPPHRRRGTDRDYDYNVNAIQTFRLNPANKLRIGVNYNRWKTPTGSHFFWEAPSDVHSFAGLVIQELHRDRLVVDWGVRYRRDYYRIRSNRGFTVGGPIRGADVVEREWGGPQISGSAGAVYELTENIGVFAHAGAGRSEPEPDRVTFDGSSLRNETRWTGDAGIEFKGTGLGFVKLGAFLVYREDAVLFDREVGPPPFAAYYENRDVAQYGLELEIRSAVLAGIATVYWNATMMDSRQRRPGSGWRTMTEVPNIIVTGGVYADYRAWDVNLFGRAVDNYQNNRFNADDRMMELGGYQDINLTVGYAIGAAKTIRLYATARNILDQKYSTVDGWRHFGTEYAVGIQHRF